jgi:galactokinase
MTDTKKIRVAHQKTFQDDPLIVRSPGRINIIGEHTDYNEGFVLPAAIDKYVYVSISARQDRLIELVSLNFDQRTTSHLDHLEPVEQHWANYVLGVVHELAERFSYGFNLCIEGNIPLGAGMSSSAALESATGYAISRLFDLEIDRLELAKIGQRCEHRFIGVKCGIMDQFISLFGKAGHVVKLDCRDLSHSYFAMELGSYTLLLLNTNIKHSLASTAYNDRRAACERAVELLKEGFPHVRSLRDVSLDMLDDIVKEQDTEAYRKARFVVEEIARVEDTCQQLQEGNIRAIGSNMYETHTGLSRDYEVSCPELDFLVDFVKRFPQVIGARMMGGGFGGCTINIVQQSFVKDLIAAVRVDYKEQFGFSLDHYCVDLRNGTEVVN